MNISCCFLNPFFSYVLHMLLSPFFSRSPHILYNGLAYFLQRLHYCIISFNDLTLQVEMKIFFAVEVNKSREVLTTESFAYLT